MENTNPTDKNKPESQSDQQGAKPSKQIGTEENIFDDELSDGKNSLGENPEQILYNNPANVEDASQIVSDGNEN